MQQTCFESHSLCLFNTYILDHAITFIFKALNTKSAVDKCRRKHPIEHMFKPAIVLVVLVNTSWLRATSIVRLIQTEKSHYYFNWL